MPYTAQRAVSCAIRAARRTAHGGRPDSPTGSRQGRSTVHADQRHGRPQERGKFLTGRLLGTLSLALREKAV